MNLIWQAMTLGALCRWGFVLTVTFTGWAAVSCGSSKTESPKPAPGGSKPDASTFADASSSPLPGDSSATADAAMTCVADQCEGFVIEPVGFPLQGCCTEDARCGVDLTFVGAILGFEGLTCEQLERPGSVSAACPNSPVFQNDLLAQGNPQGSDEVIFRGCCQPTGDCGYAMITPMLNLGCVDPGTVGQPSPGSCSFDDHHLISSEDYRVIYPGSDAGSTDAAAGP